MESFKGSTGFCYKPGPEPMGESESEAEAEAFSGVLNIYVHHARNIHNICIYGNQDVYAKFSLTCSPDEALSTRIVKGGGKNPRFDESLRIKLLQPDVVLKCEIWMLSRARNYLEDQLLGFALVPLSLVAEAKGKLTQDFTLSSTDLFHSPAGTVQLTLSLDTSLDPSDKPLSASTPNSSSISSEVVLLDPVEYGRIEFPDIDVARENQQMVSEYFDMAAQSSPPRMIAAAPFLHLGASSQCMEDYEMTAVNSGEENSGKCVSPEGSYQNSGLFSSTATSLSDDRNSADSMERKSHQLSNHSHVEVSQSSGASPVTPTSKNMDQISDQKDSNLSSKEETVDGGKQPVIGGDDELGSVFKTPLGNINLEAEQSAMQQQIVDMYMRSMQQFTESLANMKLPMDLDNLKSEDGADIIQSQNNKLDGKKKKDASRVFYGSRAFF